MHWSEPRAQATFPRFSIQERTPYRRTLREVCDGGDEEASFQDIAPRGLPDSPGGLNNDETDSGPGCDCIGSNACTGGSSPNGIDADCVYVRKPIPSPEGELGGILGGYREDVHSDCGEIDGRRNDPELGHVRASRTHT